jgi:hypothetical protein
VILPMILKVWQVLAEMASPAKMGFGETRRPTYVDYAAGTCVTNLLTVYTNYTLPLLLGLVAPRPGPFFMSRPILAYSPAFQHMNRASSGASLPVRTL